MHWLKMMTMMESTTTIDLADTDAPTQETSIDEIHIETTEERFHFLLTNIFLFAYFQIIIFQQQWNNFPFPSADADGVMCRHFSFIFFCWGQWLHFVLGKVIYNLYIIWIGGWFGWLLERQVYVTHSNLTMHFNIVVKCKNSKNIDGNSSTILMDFSASAYSFVYIDYLFYFKKFSTKHKIRFEFVYCLLSY